MPRVSRSGIIVLAVLVCSNAGADVLEVPGEYPTIQAAIDAAGDGDEVVVGPGTYIELLDLFNKPITLRSSDGPEVTILDAQSSGNVIVCSNCQGAAIQGFTITGGVDTPNQGGGLHVQSSIVEMSDCRFMANHAIEVGGAVVIENSAHVTFTGCHFEGNTADLGGAITAWDGTLILEACTFVNNSAKGQAGAIWASTPELHATNCIFMENAAEFGAGAVFFEYITTINACLFDGNTGSCGGAMNIDGSNNYAASVTDCSFLNNHATDDGGALLITIGNADALVLKDNHFSGNVAADDGGAISMIPGNFEGLWQSIDDSMFDANQARRGGAIASEVLTGVQLTLCTFDDNVADEVGGAVHIERGACSFLGCTLEGNTATFGGGLHVQEVDEFQTSAELMGCTIATNDAVYGGGVYMRDGAELTATHTDFLGNAAFNGGAIRLFLAFAAVSDCTIGENIGEGGGGGVSNWEGVITVADTTLCANAPDDFLGYFEDLGGLQFLARCPPPCSDVNNDGEVGPADLAAVLAAWGAAPGHPADLNGDGVVNSVDLAAVLNGWGPCPAG